MSYAFNAMTTLSPPPTIAIKDAAVRLGVHENTIRSWVDRGLLDGYRTPTGRRKIRVDEVERLQREMYGVPSSARELSAPVPTPPQAGRLERADSKLR
jgi:excisionase family DNA binding protein